MDMLVQRWLFRRDRYRPAGETINPRRYEVAPIGAKEAQVFVRTHHYAGSWVYDRFRFGLFLAGRLVGAAVYSQPVNNRVLTMFPGDDRQRCELGRFVLLDEVPANGESWFLCRTFELLRAADILDPDTGEIMLDEQGDPLRMQAVVSFSDPVPRLNEFPGPPGRHLPGVQRGVPGAGDPPHAAPLAEWARGGQRARPAPEL